MQWIYLTHKFHNLSWITEINELFHDILIYWDAPVYAHTDTHTHIIKMYNWVLIHHVSISNALLCDEENVISIVKNNEWKKERKYHKTVQPYYNNALYIFTTGAQNEESFMVML